MALSDFLQNGTVPSGSAITANTTQSILPDWYTNTAMDILSKQQEVTNTPYATFQGPRVADFTPGQRQGFGMTNTAATAYQPGLNAATGTVNNTASMPTGMSAALPYLSAAGGNVANPTAYMDPYIDNVVNRVAALGNRNLMENIMPGIEGRYIGAGQLGFGPRDGVGTPTGMMTDTARAIRDTQDNITAQQGQLLSQGWTNAQGAMGSDLNRFAGLGSTAAGITNNDVSNGLNIGNAQAGLAGMAQQYGLTGANAVTATGAQQQELDQKNYDVAYQDFLRQQEYPQGQINNAVSTFKGALPGVPTATNQEGIVPSGNNSNAPSTASTIASGLAGAAGLLSLLK